jgi:hypothetical protein
MWRFVRREPSAAPAVSPSAVGVEVEIPAQVTPGVVGDKFRLSCKYRVVMWLIGTGIASILPVAGVVVATLFVEQKTLSWNEICRHGDFLVIAAVLTIGSMVELIRLLMEKRLSNWDLLVAGGLALGALILLITDLILYPLILYIAMKIDVEHWPGQRPIDPRAMNYINYITAGSPLFLILAVVTGALTVRLMVRSTE